MPPKRKKGKGKRKGRGKPTVARDLKREELDREIKLSALNTARYRRLWRELIMRMTMPDIERKVEIAWQTLDHVLDLKDYGISLLLDGLEETENQRRKANGTHVETIDRFLEIHETRLKNVDTLFHRNIERTFVEKSHNFQNIEYCQNRDETLLWKINLLVNHRNESTFTAARSTTISKVDAFVEDGRNERRLVTAILQKQLEDLWDNLRSVFLDYRKSTEERRRAYNTIRKKDDFDRQVIIEQSLRITNLLEEIARYRERINSHKNDTANEMHNIIQESHFFRHAYREANEYFISGRNNDKQKAMAMSKEYNISAKHLNSLLAKAERILVCMQTCRKYETQDEKILPPVGNHSALTTRSTVVEDDDLPFNLVKQDLERLDTFWHRLGFTRVIVEELRIERNRLVMRRNDLRDSIKRWFMSETCFNA